MFGRKERHTKVEFAFADINMVPNATVPVIRHYLVVRCHECKEVLGSIDLAVKSDSDAGYELVPSLGKAAPPSVYG